MFNLLKKRLRNEKGLTLVELLAVIVILAIIAAIAIPAIGNIVQNSRDKAILADALNIIAGAKIAHMEGACNASTSTCKEDVLQDYVEGIELPKDTTVSLDGDEWEIEYPNFGKIDKDSKFYPGGTTATESKITELLDANK